MHFYGIAVFLLLPPPSHLMVDSCGNWCVDCSICVHTSVLSTFKFKFIFENSPLHGNGKVRDFCVANAFDIVVENWFCLCTWQLSLHMAEGWSSDNGLSHAKHVSIYSAIMQWEKNAAAAAHTHRRLTCGKYRFNQNDNVKRHLKLKLETTRPNRGKNKTSRKSEKQSGALSSARKIKYLN